jgi:hypothetical protein
MQEPEEVAECCKRQGEREDNIKQYQLMFSTGKDQGNSRPILLLLLYPEEEEVHAFIIDSENINFGIPGHNENGAIPSGDESTYFKQLLSV